MKNLSEWTEKEKCKKFDEIYNLALEAFNFAKENSNNEKCYLVDEAEVLEDKVFDAGFETLGENIWNEYKKFF